MRFHPDSFGALGTRAAIVGFGDVGSCLGVTLAERGLTVVAVDINQSTIDDLRAGRCRIPEPGLAEAVARLAGSPGSPSLPTTMPSRTSTS
jgi:dTDP-alpha-D-glucose dehydrogenase